LLHHSRHPARTGPDGALVPLDEQDRSRWDRASIDEALPLVEASLRRRPVSPYAIEAAIAALHARAENSARTDWLQIAQLYRVLEASPHGSPVVSLNRGVAVALAGDIETGLGIVRALEPHLAGYAPLHVAKADLLRRLGRMEAARASYRRAIELTDNEVEKRFLAKKSRGLGESRTS
ncbi:MAG: DUF6596 domain-containing protein, partial [Myxococcota bacterium]